MELTRTTTADLTAVDASTPLRNQLRDRGGVPVKLPIAEAVKLAAVRPDPAVQRSVHADDQVEVVEFPHAANAFSIRQRARWLPTHSSQRHPRVYAPPVPHGASGRHALRGVNPAAAIPAFHDPKRS